MSQRLALCALLTLSLCACSTLKTEPVKPQISDTLRAACESLPALRAEAGQDMRQALLQNRAESVLVHEQCAARHRGVLAAVGVSTVTPVAKPDRWDEFRNLLDGVKP